MTGPAEGSATSAPRDDSGRAAGRSPVLKRGWNASTGSWSSDSVAGRIIQALQNGNYLSDAVEYAGVSRASAQRWLARGAELLAGEDLTGEASADRKRFPAADRLYLDFAAACRGAEARNTVGVIARWQKAAADGDWRAGATFEARRHPENWRERQSVEVSGIVTEAAILASPAYATMRGILLDATAPCASGCHERMLAAVDEVASLGRDGDS
jgi:hypothetical protein